MVLGNLSVWQETPTEVPVARVVHCHGLGEHSERHRNTFAKLLSLRVEVFRFDFRGCGKSGGERQWIEGFEDYITDAKTVLDQSLSELPSLPTFLWGHSLGGAIALALASRQSESLAGLLLNSPAFRIGKGVSPVKVMVGRWLNKVLPHLKIPEALDLKALSRDPVIAIDYKKDPLCSRFNTVRQGNEILNALASMPLLISKVKCPLLITHGEKDNLIPIAGSRELFNAATTPDKMFKEFTGGYHELHNDINREKYLQYSVNWLLARTPTFRAP